MVASITLVKFKRPLADKKGFLSESKLSETRRSDVADHSGGLWVGETPDEDKKSPGGALIGLFCRLLKINYSTFSLKNGLLLSKSRRLFFVFPLLCYCVSSPRPQIFLSSSTSLPSPELSPSIFCSSS